MHLIHGFKKPFFAALAVALLALQGIAVPASAERAPARLDDEVARQVQSANPSQRIPVIIEGAFDAVAALDSGSLRADRAESSIRTAGGKVTGKSSLLGATVAELTPSEIRAVAANPTVARIQYDTPVKATALADSAPTGSTPIVFQESVGATAAWQRGLTGRGVTVAVLDTGIDNNNPAFGARVKARVDFVDPAHPVQGDPAGHGSHVAGVVAAGRNFVSPGVAPDADLVSVRVLDANGSSHLSTVVRGLEWVVANKSSLGIRVVIMALGAPAVTGYREDPLAAAAELAWRSGLVVVTAAGNAGPANGTIQTPGLDPLVLTVGASDDRGTVVTSDDTVPAWSSAGPTPDGLAKPDFVAPGRKIVSVRVPGSTLDVASPDHVEGPTTIRFSGTSEATGVAAGAAALLLQQRPGLEPDQTKALLVKSAYPLAGVARASQGAGELDVTRALASRTPRVERPHLPPADGVIRALLPELMKSQRVGRHADDDTNTNANTNNDGGSNVQGNHVLWDDVLWDEVQGDHLLWDHILADHLLWDHVLWDHVLWDHVLWDHVLWDHVLWDHVLWDHVLWDQTVFD